MVASHPALSPSSSIPAQALLNALIWTPRKASPVPNVVQSASDSGIPSLAVTNAVIASDPALSPSVFRLAQLSEKAIKDGISASMFAAMRAYISAFFSASFILNSPAKSWPRILTRLATALTESSLKSPRPAKKP